MLNCAVPVSLHHLKINPCFGPSLMPPEQVKIWLLQVEVHSKRNRCKINIHLIFLYRAQRKRDEESYTSSDLVDSSLVEGLRFFRPSTSIFFVPGPNIEMAPAGGCKRVQSVQLILNTVSRWQE